MIPILVVTFVAVAFLLFLVLQVRSRYLSAPDGGSVAPLAEVDLEAFRNLIDPEEEEFLRLHLSGKDFRDIQRLRLRAAILYVSALSQNVSGLVQIGQRVRTHASPNVAALGEEILQSALQLKVRCLATHWKLKVAVLCPTLLSPSGRLAERYSHVARLARDLPLELAA